MKGLLGAVAFLALGALALCAAACDDSPKSHVYVAMLYEAARDCLDPGGSLSIVSTPSGSLDCAPTCLVLPAPPATPAPRVYVSTMCGPYPAGLDTAQTDATCPAALAAFARGPDTCSAGGGSSNPTGGDAGGDDAGGEEAGTDAGGDDGDEGGSPDGGATDAPAG